MDLVTLGAEGGGGYQQGPVARLDYEDILLLCRPYAMLLGRTTHSRCGLCLALVPLNMAWKEVGLGLGGLFL